jgi:Alternative complex III, ActD subunit
MSDATSGRAKLFGLLAEFKSAQALLDAVLRAKSAGYSTMDAFTPYPVEEISEEIENHKKSKVPLLVLLGGATGMLSAVALQYWTAAVDYPVNVGGRPPFSWPAFIPVTFELTILFAAFSAVIGMLALNGLPKPYHPVFNVAAFERALQDRYFLLIESSDPQFDVETTRGFLRDLGSKEVHDVDP